MELLIAYLNDGHSITDLLYSILVIAAIIVCVEKFIKWIYDLFIKMYKRKRGQEDENTTIVKNTEQIKNLASAIDNLADLLNKQYQHLDKKIDEQKDTIERLNRELSIMTEKYNRAEKQIAELQEEKRQAEEQLAEVQSADKSNTSKQNNIFKHIFGQDKK